MCYRKSISRITLLALFLVGCSPAHKAPVRSLSQDTQKQAMVAHSTYAVQSGDTLYSIAFRYGLNYRGLARKNNISVPYKIRIGQRLILSDQVPAYSEVITPATEDVVTPTRSRSQQQPITQGTKKPTVNGPTVKQPSTVVTNKPTRPSRTPALSQPSQFDRNIKVKQWLWPIATTKRYSKRPGNQLFFKVKKGTAVRAVAAGRVVYSGKGLVGYGHLVIIKHNQNFLSAYAFNDEVLVKEKENIKAGQKIATVGASPTGQIGLGFEIRSRGKPVNPLRYLK